MIYAKFVVKNNYEKRGDLVLRSYIRALKKINDSYLLNGDVANIYGVIDDDGNFHELFTNQIIDSNWYVEVPLDDIASVMIMPKEKLIQLKKIVENVLFNQKNDLGFEISNMEELARDRAVEFDAYDKFLSMINPYQRLLSSDEDSSYNAYNDFKHKIKSVKRIHELDHEEDFDEYDIANYEYGHGAYVRK